MREKKRSFDSPVLPFNSEMRAAIDEIIDKLNDLLMDHGYGSIPVQSYDFYRKSDQEILNMIKKKIEQEKIEEELRKDESGDEQIRIAHLTMLLRRLKVVFFWNAAIFSDFSYRNGH